MTIRLKRLDAAFGVEIQGVDLSRDLDRPTINVIRDAWNMRSVVVFRNQLLTEEQLIRFTRNFGSLEEHVLDDYLHPAHPEILVVSNIINVNGRPIGISDAGRYWHSDLSYLASPSRGSFLYAVEIPERDGKPLGDTLWTNAAAAFDALPADLSQQIDGMTAVFSFEHRFERLRKDGDAGAHLRPNQRAKVPEVVHPVVRTHPVTGRKSIFVNEGHTSRLLGMPLERGHELLDRLYQHCTSPEFVYRHHWHVGDVVMWDNVPTQHLAVCDYALPQRRLLYRTTLRGDRPF